MSETQIARAAKGPITPDYVQLLRETARIPAAYQHATFDNFVLPQDPTSRADAAIARACAKRFVGRVLDGYSGQCGLMLMGTPGVGKTHLAVAALNDLIERGVAVKFVDLHRLFYTFDDEIWKMTTYFAHTDSDSVVLLDGLGVPIKTPEVEEQITLMIAGRHSQCLPTLVTTHLTRWRRPSRDLLFPEAELFNDRIGGLAASRLQEMCVPVLMGGDDFREGMPRPRW